MTWFAASIIIGFEVNGGSEGEMLVEEQVHLIEAPSSEQARASAELIGKEIEALNDGLMIGNKPARRLYAGIRRIVSTQNLYGDADAQPRHGCELTYFRMVLKSRDDLVVFIQEDDVQLQYLGEY